LSTLSPIISDLLVTSMCCLCRWHCSTFSSIFKQRILAN